MQDDFCSTVLATGRNGLGDERRQRRDTCHLTRRGADGLPTLVRRGLDGVDGLTNRQNPLTIFGNPNNPKKRSKALFLVFDFFCDKK